jgi:uncharacterized membrane protein HdeD (DUF308 family)
MRLFLTRGLIAIAWAAAFAAAADGLTAGLTAAAGILVVLYPVIDVAASLVDARTAEPSARRVLLTGAATSTLAAIALAIAATGTTADVLVVFGVWAAVSGTAQLTTALRRRAQYGLQIPMLAAGGVSVLFAAAFIITAATTAPTLMMIAIYAATGGLDFIIQAALLARRQHHPATVTA